MAEHDELLVRVVEWQRSTDPDTWRSTKLIDDLAAALRAALAARPQAVFEGDLHDLYVWADCRLDPHTTDERFVVYAVAGSATPTGDNDDG